MIGLHVVPELTVFQTPPDPTATYHSFSFSGLIAISAIRPDIKAGPTDLNLRPDKSEDFRSSALFFFFCEKPNVKNNRDVNRIKYFFIMLYLN